MTVVVGAACTYAPSPTSSPASAAPRPDDASGARQGDVAVEFLADPGAPKPSLGESQEFTPASPLSTRLPEYPAAALSGGGPSAVVAVRLSISDAGGVARVTDSPRLPRYAGPFAEEFRAAVEAAVRRWSFTAARIDTLGPARDDMPQRPLAKTRYVPTYLDFAFRFSVVDGKGVVTMGGAESDRSDGTPGVHR